MTLLLWAVTITAGLLLYIIGDDRTASGVLLRVIVLACPLLLLIVSVQGRHRRQDRR